MVNHVTKKEKDKADKTIDELKPIFKGKPLADQIDELLEKLRNSPDMPTSIANIKDISVTIEKIFPGTVITKITFHRH